MGLVYAELEISSDGAEWRAVQFLVDSGAAYTVVPLHIWQPLGLQQTRQQRFALADGTSIERGISECRFRYQGIAAWSPVILGEERDTALLGAVTLETLGLVLNPFERTLKPMPMLLMTFRREPPPGATAASAPPA